MVKKYGVEFVEVDSPITEPVVKFGGQPVWVSEPRWPLSRTTGEQMQFVCQIPLDLEALDGPSGGMAYVFISNDYRVTEEHRADGTTLLHVVDRGVDLPIWEKESGENAVVIQPDGTCLVETRPLSSGPSLYKAVDRPADSLSFDRTVAVAVAVEYAVRLTPGEDPPAPPYSGERSHWDLEREFAFRDKLLEWGWKKIGGTPYFVQDYANFDFEGTSKLLLLQMDDFVPFEINFGGGVCYAFVAANGSEGEFFWDQ